MPCRVAWLSLTGVQLERCRRQLQANIRIVYDVFDYYCILTSGEAFAMRVQGPPPPTLATHHRRFR